MRILSFLSVLLGIFTIVFFSIRIIPGDPIDAMLGDNVSSISREEMKVSLGLNFPIQTQYFESLKKILHGDFGTSIAQKKAVTPLIINAFWKTLLLTIVATAFANLVGIPLGVMTVASRTPQFDTFATILSTWVSSLPIFWIGPLFISAFALHWPWFEISGGLHAIALPAITLSVGFAAIVFQTTRAAILETSSNEFIRTAIAKGLSYNRAIFKHALPNAYIPILTVSASHFGQLLAGALITETVFDWPGIGQLLFQAIAQRDYPIIQATTFCIAVCTLLTNTTTEFLIERNVRAQK